ETVATPIEQQVNGVENMLYMSSQSTSDGNMTLSITFKLGTNLDTAQVLVQNRVAIAIPVLPPDVQRIGVTTKKQSPDITMVVHLVSPDGSLDQLFTSNYALLQIRDELARLDGVGDINVFAARDYTVNSGLGGKPATAIAIFQLPGSNALATSDAVRKKMAELKQRFPAGLDYTIVYDPTVSVRESIHEVQKTLFEAIGLVV